MKGLGEAPVTPVAQQQFYEEPAYYVTDLTLIADENRPDQAQYVDADSDFVWLGLAGSSTGDYQIRFRLPNGRYLSSAPIQNANLIGTAQFPVALPKPVVCGAGAQIGFDIEDLSSADNVVQLIFVGLKRYRA